MIGIATRADGDLVEKTQVLRASADELALRVEDQTAEVRRLRAAIDQLKSDHTAHITKCINRMNDIDAEMLEVAKEKHAAEKKTAEALKQIEKVRRDLVHIGAQLSREFIMLPAAVSKYPRLDAKATEKIAPVVPLSSSTSGGLSASAVSYNNNRETLSNNEAIQQARECRSKYYTQRGSQWYTDDIPAVNLQCVDTTISAAVAALDGRITDDEEFRAELDAARTNPDSIFSKESLIKSVAASSPMRRRRASLLMLAQASAELAKQSATFDSLTRHPHRWTESERLLAVRAAETQDLMIRDAVKELCKNAPVPRQAERQLLTALNMHALSTAAPQVKKAHFVDDGLPGDVNSGPLSPPGGTFVVKGASQDATSPTRSASSNSRRNQQQQVSPSRGRFGGTRVNVQTDALGDSVTEFATAARGSGRDPLLRRLQAELEDEQSAMGLRTHAARVRAWQELDIKRAARTRSVAQEEQQQQHQQQLMRFGGEDGLVLDALVMDGEKGEKTTTVIQSTMKSVSHVPPPKVLATPASVFSMVMTSANVLSGLPAAIGDGSSGGDETLIRESASRRRRRNQQQQQQGNDSADPYSRNYGTPPPREAVCVENVDEGLGERKPVHIRTFAISGEHLSQSSKRHNNSNKNINSSFSPFGVGASTSAAAAAAAAASSPAPLTVHRSTGLLVRPALHQILSPTAAAATAVPISEFDANASILDQAYAVLDEQRERREGAARKLAAEEEAKAKKERDSALTPSSPITATATATATVRKPNNNGPPARSGIADPESATEAITMRRTGRLETPLSFAGSRLDYAAAKAGVVRPPSAGSGEPGAGRFQWKVRRIGQPMAQQQPVTTPTSAAGVD